MRTHLSILILLAAAGCNEVTTFTDAGGDDDTTIDGSADPDAPTTGAVTVITRTRTGGDAAVEGSQVIAVGPDGTLRDSATTDADGTATVDVIAGDSVTAIYPLGPNSSRELVTTVGVEPGDTLTYGNYYLDSSTSTGTLVATWPEGTNVAYWYVYTDCYSTYVPGATLTTTLTRYERCGDDTTDVLIVGHQTGDGQPTQWAKLEDVAWASGVASFTGAYQAAPTITISGSGIPSGISYVELGASGQLGPVRVYGPYASASPPVDGAFSATGRFVVGDGGFGHWAAYREARGLGGQQGTIGMTSPTELRLDDPALLPFVSRPEINPAARQAIWIQTEGAPYDVTYFYMSYSTAPPSLLPGIGGGSYYSWTMILPPGVTRLDFPTMPEGYEEHLPPADVSVYGDIMLVEDEHYDGYRDARNAPEWQIRCSYECTVDLAMPRRTWSRYGGK